MESANLLTDTVSIELERQELSKLGLTWTEVERTLSNKYRESSKKSLFRCKCCNTVTHMVLAEGKSCHFKHASGTECAGSRNYNRYTSTIHKYEAGKHRVGCTIIKDQLQKNLSRAGASVLDGYFYKRDLHFVPDVIVQWPSGEEWTFDYITGTRDINYQNYLSKKQEEYHQRGFKSYFFFDHGQLVFKASHNALAFSISEKGSLRFHSGSEQLEKVLAEAIAKFGETAVVGDPKLSLKSGAVQRILYVTNEIDGVLYHVSPLALKTEYRDLGFKEIPDRWYMAVGQERLISLSALFEFNREQKLFKWEIASTSQSELKLFSSTIEDRYIAIQEEEKVRREQLEQQKREKLDSKRLNENVPRGHTVKYEHAPLTVDYQIIEKYQEVIEMMRNSEVIRAAPGFEARITDCEKYITVYQETGELPGQIHTLINMMKNALGL